MTLPRLRSNPNSIWIFIPAIILLLATTPFIRMSIMSRLANKIRIDTVVDITCPFCFHSSIQLDRAIKQYKQTHPDVDFHIKVLPYLLDSSMAIEPVRMDEYGPKKFGEERWTMVKRVKGEKLKAAGFSSPTEAFTSSTIPPHRLLQYTLQHKPEAQWPLALDLFLAHHVNGTAPSDRSTLISKAIQHGVFASEGEAGKFVDGNEFEQEVRDLNTKARESGIKSVPHYVFQEGDVSPESKTQEQFLEIFDKYVK